MSLFPEWVIPYSGGPLQSKPIQRMPLNIGNLMNSIPKATAAPASKRGTTPATEKPIKGLEGSVNQYYGNLDRVEEQQRELLDIYGSDAILTPEWKKTTAISDKVTSPQYQNIIDRKTKETDTYREATKTSGELYNLGEFVGTGGLRTMSHNQVIHNQENGQHRDIPNLYGEGLMTPYGLDKNAPYYIEGLSLNPNMASHTDALKELDSIFGDADNQFNETARSWVQKQTVSHISGTQTMNQSDANDFFQLEQAAQEALFNFGLAPKVMRDSRGIPLVKRNAKGIPVDKEGKPTTNREKYQYEYDRDKSGNIQTEGGFVDINSDLGAGMLQGFLSASNGGLRYAGKDLRHEDDGANHMKGMVNDDFWKQFNNYVGTQIGDAYSKRANVKSSKSTAFREERAHQAKVGAMSDEIARVLHGYTKLPAGAVLQVGKMMDIPVTEKEEDFWSKIYSGMNISDPTFGVTSIFKSSRGNDGSTYTSYNNNMTPDMFEAVVNNYLDKEYENKSELNLRRDPETGALTTIYNDEAGTNAGNWSKEEYKDYLMESYNKLYSSTQGKKIQSLNGIAKYNKYNFANSPAVKEALENFNFRKKGSSKMALSEFNNKTIKVSAGSSHDAQAIFTNNMEIVSWSGSLQLDLRAKPSNFVKTKDGRHIFIGEGGEEISAPELKDKKFFDAGNGGLLPTWSEETFESASQMTNASVKQNHPNSMQIAPTGYFSKVKVKVNDADLKTTLEKWGKMKVYTDQQSFNPTVLDRHTDMIATIAYSQGKLPVAHNRYSEIANEIYYGTEKQAKERVKKEYGLTEKDYNNIAKNIDPSRPMESIAEDYLKKKMVSNSQDPSDYMTTAKQISFFKDGNVPSVDEFRAAVKENRITQYVQPEAAAMMEFALDGENNDLIFHANVDVTEVLDNSQFLNQQETKSKYYKNNVDYINNMREGAASDIDADLRPKQSLLNLYGQ